MGDACSSVSELRLVFQCVGDGRPPTGEIKAEKKPNTPEEVAAVIRQAFAKNLDRRFRESGLSRGEFDAEELAKLEHQRAESERARGRA